MNSCCKTCSKVGDVVVVETCLINGGSEMKVLGIGSNEDVIRIPYRLHLFNTLDHFSTHIRYVFTIIRNWNRLRN